MSKHTIQISDEDGKSFNVIVSIGFLGSSIGSWRSLETGFIRYGQGRVEYRMDEGSLGLSTRDLYFFDSPQSSNFGLRLNEYDGWTGLVNDQGMGYLWQPWVLNFKPYRISWELLT